MTKKKSSSKSFKNVLIVVFGLICIAVVFNLYIARTKSQSQSTPIPNETSNNAIPSDMKMYTDTRFSFEYPEDWERVDEYGNTYFGTPEVNYKKYSMALEVLSIDIEAAKRYLNWGDTGYSNKATEINTQMIDGVEVTKATVIFSEFVDMESDWKVAGENYIILIPLGEASTLRLSGDISQKETLNQILSTFKLTN